MNTVGSRGYQSLLLGVRPALEPQLLTESFIMCDERLGPDQLHWSSGIRVASWKESCLMLLDTPRKILSQADVKGTA